MTDDQPDLDGGRRTVLKSLGALGVVATTGQAAADSHTSASPDSYHETLRSDLTGRGGTKTLPAGEYVYGVTEQTALETFTLQQNGTESSISVDTDAVPITQGDRLEIDAGLENADDASYRGTVGDHSFSAGDVLLAVAYVRSDDDDAEAMANFKYEYTDTDGSTSYSENYIDRGAHVEPNGKWRRYFFPIEVGEKPAGSNHTPFLEFWTGYTDQTIEFGGLALIDYSDSDVGLGTLPPYDYAGRAEDADWRDAAQQRIEDVRKTDIEVTVVDADGNAVPEADVNVAMTEHEFTFGSAVSVGHINGDSEDDEIYRETFLENFNKAVIENGLKYPAFLGTWGDSKEGAKEALQWLNERDVPTRGHYLLWEEYSTSGGGGMGVNSNLAADVVEDIVDQRIENHATDIGEMVSDWDMHNHPIWQSNFRDDEDLGWAAVDRWWQTADQATDQPLYTNEMGQVGGTWQQDQYYEFISHLVENDYPIDGIGFMAHHQQWWDQMLDMSTLKSSYDRFEEFDLPVLITEFDIQVFSRRNAQDVEVQTDYTRDFLTMTFSHPVVEGILSWGFWEDDHWRPTGAYFNSDWSLRPNGEVYQDLVYDEWWTEESGQADGSGTYTTRGFKGEYLVAARDGDQIGVAAATFDDENGTVTVELESLSGIQGTPADLDHDGTVEDVDGDGDLDLFDALSYYNNGDSDAIKNNPELFDFDNDGDAGDLFDALELYNQSK